MRLFSASDQLLCQVFPTTLSGRAFTWFHHLEDGRIKNFAELAQLFTDQFFVNQILKRLHSRPGGIRREEAVESHHRRSDRRPKIRKNQEAAPHVPPEEDSRCLKMLRQDGCQSRAQVGGPREPSLATMFFAIRNRSSLRRPRPLSTNSGDPLKYCAYHRGQGHETEECCKLREEVKRLGDPKTISKRGRPRATTQKPSSSPEKKRSKQLANVSTTTACTSRVNWAYSPPEEPLVINVEFGNHPRRAGRMLVDDRIAENLLFLPNLPYLELESGSIQLGAAYAQTPQGTPVLIIGTIDLPVTLGRPPMQVTYDEQFTIISADSDAHGVLKGSLLEAFQASARSYHSLLKLD